jgi:hypothetical protein
MMRPSIWISILMFCWGTGEPVYSIHSEIASLG